MSATVPCGRARTNLNILEKCWSDILRGCYLSCFWTICHCFEFWFRFEFRFWHLLFDFLLNKKHKDQCWKHFNQLKYWFVELLTKVPSPFFTCVFTCLIRSSDRAKPLAHSGQMYGFSFVWHLVWVLKWSFLVNRRGQ